MTNRCVRDTPASLPPVRIAADLHGVHDLVTGATDPTRVLAVGEGFGAAGWWRRAMRNSVNRAIADGRGPKHAMLALGYAGWGPGQLDAEMQANGWLNAPADDGLLYDRDLDTKWERAIAKLGVSLSMLSGEAGHASQDEIDALFA